VKDGQMDFRAWAHGGGVSCPAHDGDLRRGHFKDVHGSLEFDPENPRNSSVEVKIDARRIWTGVKERDDHLRRADFLDVEQHPDISFKGNQVEIKGEHDYAVTGDLTIRGVTRQV